MGDPKINFITIHAGDNWYIGGSSYYLHNYLFNNQAPKPTKKSNWCIHYKEKK